jgi:fumarate reductase subunit D
LLQLLELGVGLFAGLLGQLGLGDLVFQLGDLVRAVLAVAQLALDRLHLLVQVILALRALHLRFHAGLDLLLDLQDDISPCIRP